MLFLKVSMLEIKITYSDCSTGGGGYVRGDMSEMWREDPGPTG